VNFHGRETPQRHPRVDDGSRGAACQERGRQGGSALFLGARADGEPERNARRTQRRIGDRHCRARSTPWPCSKSTHQGDHRRWGSRLQPSRLRRGLPRARHHAARRRESESTRRSTPGPRRHAGLLVEHANQKNASRRSSAGARRLAASGRTAFAASGRTQQAGYFVGAALNLLRITRLRTGSPPDNSRPTWDATRRRELHDPRWRETRCLTPFFNTLLGDRPDDGDDQQHEVADHEEPDVAHADPNEQGPWPGPGPRGLAGLPAGSRSLASRLGRSGCRILTRSPRLQNRQPGGFIVALPRIPATWVSSRSRSTGCRRSGGSRTGRRSGSGRVRGAGGRGCPVEVACRRVNDDLRVARSCCAIACCAAAAASSARRWGEHRPVRRDHDAGGG